MDKTRDEQYLDIILSLCKLYQATKSESRLIEYGLDHHVGIDAVSNRNLAMYCYSLAELKADKPLTEKTRARIEVSASTWLEKVLSDCGPANRNILPLMTIIARVKAQVREDRHLPKYVATILSLSKLYRATKSGIKLSEYGQIHEFEGVAKNSNLARYCYSLAKLKADKPLTKKTRARIEVSASTWLKKALLDSGPAKEKILPLMTIMARVKAQVREDEHLSDRAAQAKAAKAVAADKAAKAKAVAADKAAKAKAVAADKAAKAKAVAAGRPGVWPFLPVGLVDKNVAQTKVHVVIKDGQTKVLRNKMRADLTKIKQGSVQDEKKWYGNTYANGYNPDIFGLVYCLMDASDKMKLKVGATTMELDERKQKMEKRHGHDRLIKLFSISVRRPFEIEHFTQHELIPCYIGSKSKGNSKEWYYASVVDVVRAISTAVDERGGPVEYATVYPDCPNIDNIKVMLRSITSVVHTSEI